MDAKSLPRALTATVHAAVADTPVVCLLGPRQCGKPTLARALAPRFGYVTFGDDFAGGVLIHAGPHLVTRGDHRLLAVPLAKLWEM